ncbi:galactosyltransferase-related protein [Paeniglutamicibacter quisquiliarum]|uniref:galactosyltransferase-related protein n=1 Tax=Paeniglutamicibacter quisquiliarum TaxID=2849498 RepID=UPI003AB98294
MMAIDRHSYGVLRGFDERMHTYGREDMDFAARARRAGLRMVWVEDQKARMYHMWHPSSADALQDSPAAIAALKQNRSIFDNDGTVARNRTIWNNSLPEAPPLISICLLSGYESIKDGRLADTIALQNIRDVEVLVSATGGQVQAATIESLVREVDCQVGDLDSMLEVAAGKYTIVLDSSYCLPETFLEELLVDAQGSVRAVVPRQLAFDPETNGFGFMPIGDENRTNTLLGVLAQTDILRSLSREQNISTINPGFLEILNSLGAEVLFSENAICLVEAKESVQSSIRRYEIPSEIRRILWPLFSDSDTSRIAKITGGPVETLASEKFDGSLEFSVVKRDDEITSRLGVLGNASLTDLARLRNLGCDFTVDLEPIDQAENSGRGIRWIISEAMFAIGQSDVIPHAVIVVEGEHDGRGFATPDARPLCIKVERLGLDDHEKATLFFSNNALETSNILEFADGRVRFILSQPDWEIGS